MDIPNTAWNFVEEKIDLPFEGVVCMLTDFLPIQACFQEHISQVFSADILILIIYSTLHSVTSLLITRYMTELLTVLVLGFMFWLLFSDHSPSLCPSVQGPQAKRTWETKALVSLVPKLLAKKSQKQNPKGNQYFGQHRSDTASETSLC